MLISRCWWASDYRTECNTCVVSDVSTHVELILSGDAYVLLSTLSFTDSGSPVLLPAAFNYKQTEPGSLLVRPTAVPLFEGIIPIPLWLNTSSPFGIGLVWLFSIREASRVAQHFHQPISNRPGMVIHYVHRTQAIFPLCPSKRFSSSFLEAPSTSAPCPLSVVLIDQDWRGSVLRMPRRDPRERVPPRGGGHHPTVRAAGGQPLGVRGRPEQAVPLQPGQRPGGLGKSSLYHALNESTKPTM